MFESIMSFCFHWNAYVIVLNVWYCAYADVPEGSFIVRAHTPMSNCFVFKTFDAKIQPNQIRKEHLAMFHVAIQAFGHLPTTQGIFNRGSSSNKEFITSNVGAIVKTSNSVITTVIKGLLRRKLVDHQSIFNASF